MALLALHLLAWSLEVAVGAAQEAILALKLVTAAQAGRQAVEAAAAAEGLAQQMVVTVAKAGEVKFG